MVVISKKVLVKINGLASEMGKGILSANEACERLSSVLTMHSNVISKCTSIIVTKKDGIDAMCFPLSLFGRRIILFDWNLIYLLLYGDSIDEILFLGTLGHEIAHTQIGIFLRKTRKYAAVCCADEVFCDFWGAKMFGINATDMADAKKKLYSSSQGIESKDFTHPSRQKRIEYLQRFSTFSYELFCEIVKDENLIKKYWPFYEAFIVGNGKPRKDCVFIWLFIGLVLLFGICVMLI